MTDTEEIIIEHNDASSPFASMPPEQTQINSNPHAKSTINESGGDDDNDDDFEKLEQLRLHEQYLNQEFYNIQNRLQDLFVQRREYFELLPEEHKMIEAKELIIIQQLHIHTLEVLGEYATIKQAASAIFARQCAIRDCLANKATRGAGYLWRYIVADQLEHLEIIRTYQEKPRECKHYNPIEKLCKVTGKVLARYYNIRIAAEANNIHVSNVYYGLLKKNYTSKGYRWRYANENNDQEEEEESQSSSMNPPRNNNNHDNNDNNSRKRSAPLSNTTKDNNNNNAKLLSELRNLSSLITSGQGGAPNTNAATIIQLITKLLLLLSQQGRQQHLQQQQQALVPLLSQMATLSQQQNNNENSDNNPHLLFAQQQAQQNNVIFQSATENSIPPVVGIAQAPMPVAATPTANTNNNKYNSVPQQPTKRTKTATLSSWATKMYDLQKRINTLDEIIKGFSNDIDDEIKSKFETKRRKLMLDLADVF